MPWSNQGDGGGPWGKKPGSGPSDPKGSGPKGPGGNGPWGGGPSGNGQRPQGLDDLFQQGQDQLKNLMPDGPMSSRGASLIGALAVVGWMATGLYIVHPDEIGLNLVFGRYEGSTQPGLNYNWPAPVGSVIKPRVTAVNTTDVGVGVNDNRTGRGDASSLMLTGDENIVYVDFAVQWQINPAKAADYAFNIRNPQGSIRAVAEAAMREVIGRRNIQLVLTTDRSAIEAEVKLLIQDVLNNYKAGVEVRLVQLQKVDPPGQVLEAFRDVQAARQDQDRLRNEAETYASRVVPEARGEAARIVQEAEAYRERVVAEANGQASRFTQVYDEYKKAPDVTRQRIYLETLEKVMGNIDKVIIDRDTGQGVVPYMALPELKRNQGAPK
ncbi:MAG: FtsH protease activity modulator HflK [Beijerinckiaceae bacterium]